MRARRAKREQEEEDVRRGSTSRAQKKPTKAITQEEKRRNRKRRTYNGRKSPARIGDQVSESGMRAHYRVFREVANAIQVTQLPSMEDGQNNKRLYMLSCLYASTRTTRCKGKAKVTCCTAARSAQNYLSLRTMVILVISYWIFSGTPRACRFALLWR